MGMVQIQTKAIQSWGIFAPLPLELGYGHGRPVEAPKSAGQTYIAQHGLELETDGRGE